VQQQEIDTSTTDHQVITKPITDFLVLGNYSCNFDFNNLAPLSSDVPLPQKYEMSFQVNLLATIEEGIFYQEPLLETTYKVDKDE
jgi:hypothetical protein